MIEGQILVVTPNLDAMRIWVGKNWCHSEHVLQHVKHALLHCVPQECMILLGQICEWLGNAGKLRDELVIEVHHSKKVPYALNIMRHLIIIDGANFSWVH